MTRPLKLHDQDRQAQLTALIPPGHFDALYGLELVSIADGEIRARTVVRQEITQPWGILHGGVYASIAEAVASIGTNLAVNPDRIAVGQSNSTSFLRPINTGTISALALARQQGRTTWVWDVEMRNVLGRLCALTRMTIALRPAEAARAELTLPPAPEAA